ncbi:hypothetical protein DICVIV_05164 [Dictyocaulus viviparus]|uniref:Uncharacterized protein n=1 Tax=Dictyocaulus viviparus TaxID=29172 RepID=A0A0D8XVS1_DICVI|nr:hypothetical protein DICVIV_05164 [Dictyocaulus viviparus]
MGGVADVQSACSWSVGPLVLSLIKIKSNLIKITVRIRSDNFCPENSYTAEQINVGPDVPALKCPVQSVTNHVGCMGVKCQMWNGRIKILGLGDTSNIPSLFPTPSKNYRIRLNMSDDFPLETPAIWIMLLIKGIHYNTVDINERYDYVNDHRPQYSIGWAVPELFTTFSLFVVYMLYDTRTLPLPHPSQCTSVEMRGPPPAWIPPCPPGRDREHDYENNYEDPEDIREKEHSSRDLLLNATSTPSKFHSYEMSLSQQVRAFVAGPSTKRHINTIEISFVRDVTITTDQVELGSRLRFESHHRRSEMQDSFAPPIDEWTSLTEGQTILHKNADGAYYIPSGSGGAVSALELGFTQIKLLVLRPLVSRCEVSFKKLLVFSIHH